VWVESSVGSLGSIWNEIVRVEEGNKLCEVVLSICLQSVSVRGSSDECSTRCRQRRCRCQHV
jgi:hypothetical protein